MSYLTASINAEKQATADSLARLIETAEEAAAEVDRLKLVLAEAQELAFKVALKEGHAQYKEYNARKLVQLVMSAAI